MSHQIRILPIIVISQFCCTSLWFAGNAVMTDLVANFHLPDTSLGHLTSAVQIGFITGTLVFALFTVSDRISPSRVFLVCAIAGAFFNLAIILQGNNLATLFALRVMTGFFLAGIYPVGMKIASDYYQQGLGKSLGYLVGALVLGTAFPHLLKGSAGSVPWTYFVVATSLLAILGGMLIFLFVPDGPYRQASKGPDLTAFLKVFKERTFRSVAFGYFGHMWELYAFWAFVPLMLVTYQSNHPEVVMNVPLLSFIIIGIGGLACVGSGYLSSYMGTKKTAACALFLSGACCVLSPLVLLATSTLVFFTFMLVWGIVVIADSPLFSTLVAKYSPPDSKGTALTIVNCLGFAITIVSIQLLTQLNVIVNPNYLYLPLAFGPLVGLIALFPRNN
jgi:MFS family permease